ncbi:MAG: 2Fe-2S iron-sulfur cluster-binding protein [Pseudomonadota bacterium]
MTRFLPLTVTDIHRTIRDAVVLTLAPDDPEAFHFVQGQYLTFRRDFDGVEVRRNYSICAGLDDGVLQVGIKRVKGGAFSTFANTELAVGDRLEAMPPVGKFHTPLTGVPRHYLAFAGGSGITPILSILRTVLSREPDSRFTLIYANRAVHTIMFREELESLKNQHMGRLTLIHVLETGQDIDLFSGRIDGDKCAALFKSWINIASVDQALICGPEPMMLAISAALQEHGMAKDQIRMELFGASQQGRLAQSKVMTDTARTAEISVTIDGTAHVVPLEPGQSLLDAAIAARLDAPYACKAGVCSTCKARVTEGAAEMRSNHALEDYEVTAGYILTCQSHPTTDHISIDYDLH